MSTVPLRLALLASVLTGFAVSAGSAQDTLPPDMHLQALQETQPAPRHDMRLPQIASAKVDWMAALASLSEVAELRSTALTVPPRQPRSSSSRPVPRALARLNAAMAQRFPGVTRSPVPVLLPFDTGALMRDLAAGNASEGNERYLSGFQASKFFYPGPSGYDAVFSLRTADVPDLADISYSEPIDVLISGSALLYELDDPTPPSGAPVVGAGNGISRHPAADPRTSPALHVRSLRRALCRFRGVLRFQRVALQDADLPRG